MKKAWWTVWNGMPGSPGIVAASTRGKAIAAVIRQASNAGYDAEWKDVRAIRAPRHDQWAAVDSTGVMWSESLLPVEMWSESFVPSEAHHAH